MKKSNLVICLMGPTASGKSHLALELAKRFDLDIVCVDSTTVFRFMDIGSAKPTPDELKVTPHRLIDFLDPIETYSAADFCKDAQREIDNIHAKGRIPLLVGGTMLYFRALQQGLSTLPQANDVVRARIIEEAKIKGWEALHQELALIDPESAKRIHPNDPQRLQRALEVYYLTGQSMTQLFKQSAFVSSYYFFNVGLLPENRQWLHDRIALRFTKMLDAGLVEEVQALYQRGDLTLQHPSMRAVGYRQVWEFLEGKITRDEMIEQGIAATRQLAKRQLTWLRHWTDLHVFACDDACVNDQIIDFIEKLLKKL